MLFIDIYICSKKNDISVWMNVNINKDSGGEKLYGESVCGYISGSLRSLKGGGVLKMLIDNNSTGQQLI